VSLSNADPRLLGSVDTQQNQQRSSPVLARI
jgi:hypothetical protein